MNKLMKYITLFLFCFISIQGYGQSIKARQSSIITVDGVDEILNLKVRLNDRIKVKSTGAEYLVENSTISGYNSGNPDGRACIDIGGGLYANIQTESGGYRYSHLFKINSTSTFQALFDLAEATGKKAIVDGSGGISSTITIPSTVNVHIEDGALITILNADLIINGSIIAGPYYIFNDVGAGTFDFTNSRTNYVLPEWWILDYSNTEPGIELAVETARKVVLNAVYTVQANINIEDRNDLILQIDGKIETTGSTAIVLERCNNVTIEGSGIIDNQNLGSGAGIIVQNENSNIRIQGITVKNTVGQGIRINAVNDTITNVSVSNINIINTTDNAFVVTSTGTGFNKFIRLENCYFDNPRMATFIDHVEHVIIQNNFLKYNGDGQHAIGIFGPTYNAIATGNIGVSTDQTGVNNLGVTLGSDEDLQNVIVDGNIMQGNSISGDAYELASWGSDSRNFVLSNNISTKHPTGIVIGVSNNDTTNYKNIAVTGNVLDSTKLGIRALTFASTNPGTLKGLSIANNVVFGSDPTTATHYGILIDGEDTPSEGFLGYVNTTGNVVSNFYEGLRTARNKFNLGYGNLLYGNRTGISYGQMDTSFYAFNMAVQNTVADRIYANPNTGSFTFDPNFSSLTLDFNISDALSDTQLENKIGAVIQGDGNPNATLTPNYIGETYIDTTRQNTYKATGLTNTDWEVTNRADNLYEFTPFAYNAVDTILADTLLENRFPVNSALDGKSVTAVEYITDSNVTTNNTLVRLLEFDPDTGIYTAFGSATIPIGSNSIEVATNQALTAGRIIYCEVSQSGDNVSGLTVFLKIE